MLIAAIIVVIIYKLHYWVERRFKIDDAVGAVAVHGYAGFLGVVAAGFVLWGYPSSPDALLGHATPWAKVTPWGQFVGAIIMFWVLGLHPRLRPVLDPEAAQPAARAARGRTRRPRLSRLR